VLEQLLALYGEDRARTMDKRVVLGRLCAFGPPWMRRIVELGRLLLDQGEKRWAWSILSPLLNVSPPPMELKQLLGDLRKEFEKADNIAALSPEVPASVRSPDEDHELTQVLSELEQRLPDLGRTSLEALGGQGYARIGETTALGKTFEGIRERLGYGEVHLYRAQELPEAVMIVASNPPVVVLRTEFVQLLGNAELAWTFAYALYLAQPGRRLLASHPEGSWGMVPTGLLAAIGFGSPHPSAAATANAIYAGIDEATRTAWAERLAHLRGPTPEIVGARHAAGIQESARRVGTVAAGDLRLVMRVFSRMYEDIPKPRTVGKVDELDEYLAEVPQIQRLLAFAAAPEFGAIVSR